VRSHSVRDIALDHLETALRLYFEGGHLASVITLSAVAEELLGKLVTASGVKNALTGEKETVEDMHRWLYGTKLPEKVVSTRANSAKNSIKHGSIDESGFIHFDLETEATDMLDRATYNYWKLVHNETALMRRYLEARHGVGSS
jgi:hypothetical protein